MGFDVQIAENGTMAASTCDGQGQVVKLTVKAILTDMDGTFTKFNLDYMGMRRAALRLLEQEGLWRPGMSDQMAVSVILKQVHGTINAGRFDEVKKRIYEKVEMLEVESAQQVQLLAGAREALDELRQMKKKIVVVTNNGRVGTELTLERLGLHGIFDGVVTRDDAEQLKPDAGIVQVALNLARVKADEAIMVGDAVIDIEAARAASVRSVAVPTGPFSGPRLLEERPDFVVGSFLEVPELVRRLDGQT